MRSLCTTRTSKDFLVVRMDRDVAAQSLKDRNTRPFDITGRPMAGWVMVAEGGWKRSTGLAKWLAIAKAYAASLPETSDTPKPRKTKTLKDYNR